MRRFLCLFLGILVTWSLHVQAKTEKEGGKNVGLIVTSTVFKEGEMIPPQFTCAGKDISPQIAWSDIPSGAKTLALIGDDPDAPGGDWVHWVVYNIPVNVKELAENTPKDKVLACGAEQGTTDFGRIGYGGPCPPSGVHRYFFKVYALDTEIKLAPGATKAQLRAVMEGHILAQGKLMGKYTKKRR